MKIFIFLILLAISLNSCKVLENKELISEKHFGGVGDGKTDNYEAFLALAKFLKNKNNIRVIFKEGVYLINQYKHADCRSYGSIECLKQFKGNAIEDVLFEGLTNVEFVGNNSSIKLKGDYLRSNDYKLSGLNFKYSCSSSVVPFLFNGCSKITLSGFKLDGGALKTSKENGVVEGSGSGIIIWDRDGVKSKDFVIRNIEYKNFISDGLIIASNGDRFNVVNCIFDNNCRQGISLVKGNDFRIEDCTIKNTGQSKVYGNHAPSAGIDVENEFPIPLNNVLIKKCSIFNNLGFQVVGTNSTNVHIDSCYIADKMNGHDSGLSSGIGLFCDFSSIKNSIIKGAIQVDISGIDITNFKNGLLIENNYIINSSHFTGVLSSDYNTPFILSNNILERIDPLLDDKNDDYFPLIRNKNAKIINNLFVYNTKNGKKSVYSIIEGVNIYENNNWYFPNISNSVELKERINNLSIPKTNSSQELIFNDFHKFNLKGELPEKTIEIRSKDNDASLMEKLRRYKSHKAKYD